MDGRIWVEPAGPPGATLVVELPIERNEKGGSSPPFTPGRD
jgi:hypothetical protein